MVSQVPRFISPLSHRCCLSFNLIPFAKRRRRKAKKGRLGGVHLAESQRLRLVNAANNHLEGDGVYAIPLSLIGARLHNLTTLH